jgi:hypothetical protein
LIDVLPPGLYEATFERKGADTVNPDLVSSDWVTARKERSTISALSAEMMQRTIVALLPPLSSRKST